jgi:hypothetical protein
MTWKPTMQPECGPGCTCTGIPTVTPEPEPRPAVLRTCGSIGCGSCPPVTKWNTPGNRKATT